MTSLLYILETPAFADVLPSKIFEAMAMVCRYFCVPGGEASELIQSHDAGVWIPAGDPKLFSDTISLI